MQYPNMSYYPYKPLTYNNINRVSISPLKKQSMPIKPI